MSNTSDACFSDEMTDVMPPGSGAVDARELQCLYQTKQASMTPIAAQNNAVTNALRRTLGTSKDGDGYRRDGLGLLQLYQLYVCPPLDAKMVGKIVQVPARLLQAPPVQVGVPMAGVAPALAVVRPPLKQRLLCSWFATTYKIK